MTPNSSILEVFASGNATVDQWLGLFVLAVAGFVKGPGLADVSQPNHRRAALLGGEILLEAHRMNEVVNDVDIVEGRFQRGRIAEVAVDWK